MKNSVEGYMINMYVILDDDPSLFDEGIKTPRLYITSAQTGLTLIDVKRLVHFDA